MSGYAFFVQETSTQPKETWVRNGMIFATESEAKQYGCDLMSRWFGICGGEVREVAEVPTHRWVDGRAESLQQQICEALHLADPDPQFEGDIADEVGPCRGGCGIPSPEVRP